MKLECEIARDLMPLCMDAVASESSEKMVRMHVSECLDCAAYFDSMKTSPPPKDEAEQQAEQKAFDQAAAAIKKQKRRRACINVLLGVLIGMVLLFGGFFGWDRLSKITTNADLSSYNVFLSQFKDGRVVFSVDYKGSFRYMMTEIDEVLEGEDHILYVSESMYLIPQDMLNPKQNGSCMTMNQNELQEYTEIRQGNPEDFLVIWKQGESIPAASDEMESYFFWWDYSDLFEEKYTYVMDGKVQTRALAQRTKLDAINQQMHAVQATVPEWQPWLQGTVPTVDPEMQSWLLQTYTEMTEEQKDQPTPNR